MQTGGLPRKELPTVDAPRAKSVPFVPVATKGLGRLNTHYEASANLGGNSVATACHWAGVFWCVIQNQDAI